MSWQPLCTLALVANSSKSKLQIVCKQLSYSHLQQDLLLFWSLEFNEKLLLGCLWHCDCDKWFFFFFWQTNDILSYQLSLRFLSCAFAICHYFIRHMFMADFSLVAISHFNNNDPDYLRIICMTLIIEASVCTKCDLSLNMKFSY